MHWGFNTDIILSLLICLPFFWLARLIIGSLFGDTVVVGIVLVALFAIGIEAKSWLYWIILLSPVFAFMVIWISSPGSSRADKRAIKSAHENIARGGVSRANKPSELLSMEKEGKARWYNEPMS